MGAQRLGANGGFPPLGASDSEMAAYRAGLLEWQARGGAGPGAAGGIVALIPALLLALPAITIGTCLFPLAGVLTLVACSLVAGLLDERVSFLVMLIAVLVPGIVVFSLGLGLEGKLERFEAYRMVRMVLRILVVGFVANAFAFAFHGAGRFRPDTPFLDRLTPLHVGIVLAGMAAAYFGSRFLDRNLGGAAGFGAKFRVPWRRRSPATAFKTA
jgi:hypothetical protein